MAPFSEAIRCDLAEGEPEKDELVIFGGTIDGEWTVASVPHGGYLLAIIINACIQFQAGTPHSQPIHVTAHFLQSPDIGPYEVHVRAVRKGRTFTNIVAELLQKGRVAVTTHSIFGDFHPPPSTPQLRSVLAPPLPYARRLPLEQHPATLTRTEKARPFYTFKDRVLFHRDHTLTRPLRSNEDLQFGTYLEFTDKDERLNSPALAMLADLMVSTWVLLPHDPPYFDGSVWFPTLTMNIEFKFPLPSPEDTRYSNRTIALYSRGHFMNDPQNRHEEYVELWTAPSNIGEGNVHEGWKEDQRCLAVATQTALVVPGSVNERRGKAKSSEAHVTKL